MGAGGILALDLGTCTGFAYARPGAEPVYGSHRLPGASGLGRFFTAFRSWLAGRITVFDPRLIVYEAPLITGSKTHFDTALKLIGLAMHVEQIADLRELLCAKANNQTVKKFVAGRGGAQKVEVADVVRAYGWEPDNNNVSDALAILLWAEAKWAPKAPQRQPGPIFARAEAAE